MMIGLKDMGHYTTFQVNLNFLIYMYLLSVIFTVFCKGMAKDEMVGCITDSVDMSLSKL